MKLTKFNLNSYVWVEVTKIGLTYIPQENKEFVLPTKTKINGKTYYKMQAWEMMIWFAPKMYMGNPFPPIVMDILLTETD